MTGLLFGPDDYPGWPFADLQPHGYQVILLDPPWYYEAYSEKGEAKNPLAHYDCMTMDQLRALPIGMLAAPNCVMVMWGTAPLLPEAIDLLRHYGFTFKTAGAWAKRSSTGEKWQFGTGYILRSAMEPYIVGTIGEPAVLSHSVRNLIVAPVREHSRKPDQLYLDIEKLWAGPYVELFSRSARTGWDAWGNQVGKFTGTGLSVSGA